MTLLHLLVCLRSEFSYVKKEKVDLLFNNTASLWNTETKKAFTMESECIEGILAAAATCDWLYMLLADKQEADNTAKKSAKVDGDDSSAS
jgi:hypothetical protein